MNEKGKFIVIEGLEGAGKSTALNTISAHLDKLKIPYLVTREPGGTKVGEAIRAILKDPLHENLDPVCELLLLYAARVQLLNTIIKPTLAKGTWVIADRFELSTFAYQGGGRQLSLNNISQISNICLQNFRPDLILFLDINPEQGFNRIKTRNHLDRIEREPLEFFHKVYKTYQQLIPTIKNLIVINAEQPLANVQIEMIKQLNIFLNQIYLPNEQCNNK